VPSSKGYRNIFQVHVQGVNQQTNFLNTVGCSGKRGEIIPMLLVDLNEIEPHWNLDIIPKEVWPLYVNSARQEKSLSWRDVCKNLNMSYCGSTLFKSGVSRARMHQLNQFLESPKLSHLAMSDILWDEIVSLEEGGEEDVFDATVEGIHNFVANDILVHNSIEQDADIVMFLLRREYYDPMDKPGMAEVIVGKNRHGAVGTVSMTYRKEIAQFANYIPIQAERYIHN